MLKSRKDGHAPQGNFLCKYTQVWLNFYCDATEYRLTPESPTPLHMAELATVEFHQFTKPSINVPLHVVIVLLEYFNLEHNSYTCSV